MSGPGNTNRPKSDDDPYTGKQMREAEAAEERRRYEDAESWREHPGWCRCQRVCGGDQ